MTLQKYYLAFVVLIIALGSTPRILYGQHKSTDRKAPNVTGLVQPKPPTPVDNCGSLLGLTEFSVLVEDIDDTNALARGVTTKQIQTDMELKLRKAGVKVITNERDFSPNHGTVYINLGLLQGDGPFSGMYVWSISVKVLQEVHLQGNRSMLTSTWDTHGAGYVGKDNLDELRKKISDMTDGFLNDYLAITLTNPPPIPKIHKR